MASPAGWATDMGTFAITGAASGMGAATAQLLRAAGHQVIGVDRQPTDIVADLATPAGRRAAIEGVRVASGGILHGAAMFAGVGGATGRAASLLVSVNYFGTVELLTAFRPLLAAAGESAAIAISSNAATCQPGWNPALVDACLSGGEARARAIGDQGDSAAAYPATKLGRGPVRSAATLPRRSGPGRASASMPIAPGLVETPFVAETRADPVLGPLIDLFPLPLGRGGEPAEIAALAAFMLSPAARFFCGSVICCDGGTDALLRPDDWPARWGAGGRASPECPGQGDPCHDDHQQRGQAADPPHRQDPQ